MEFSCQSQLQSLYYNGSILSLGALLQFEILSISAFAHLSAMDVLYCGSSVPEMMMSTDFRGNGSTLVQAINRLSSSR